MVAGGTGTRMNSEIPKQFLLLAGQPLLMHTIRVFYHFDPDMKLFVVLPENQFHSWEQLCLSYSFSFPHHLVKGGETRFCSVKNALDLINGEGLVAIHDGVRPLVSIETLKRTFEKAKQSGNAIPVIRMQDSIREICSDGSKEIVRENIRIVQTPQVFQSNMIKKAYDLAIHQNFTDDATVFETLGETICLVEGNYENIKITWPSDLSVAESFLKNSALQD